MRKPTSPNKTAAECPESARGAPAAEARSSTWSVLWGVARPKRRWFQFSLRTIFIVMALFALWLGVITGPTHEQKRAVEVIQRDGGEVRYDYEELGNVEPPGPSKAPMAPSRSSNCSAITRFKLKARFLSNSAKNRSVSGARSDRLFCWASC